MDDDDFVNEYTARCVSPALRKLAHDAWTRGDEMRVFIDTLLERGIIKPNEGPELEIGHAGPQDTALFFLESAAREWTVDLHPDLELRVTGGWPDIFYVVFHNPLKARTGKGFETLTERVAFEGVYRQSRLLRDP